MNLSNVNKVMEKYWLPKTVAFITAPRYCTEHAEEGWEGKNLDQTVYMKPGICETCKKFRMVGYIEEL